MNKHLLYSLENNWDDLKDKIKSQWKKLTDDDIEQISGSYDRLIAKLKKAYALKAEAIENEVSEFFANNDLIQQAAANSETVNLPAIKAAISDHLEDYVKFVKDKSRTIETSTKKYVQGNPFKWLGVAVLSGIVLAKFIRF